MDLKKIINFLPKSEEQRIIEMRKKYFDVLKTEEYLSWQELILSKIYDKFEFTSILKKKYPIICFSAKENYEYPFNQVIDKDDLNITINDFKLNTQIQKEYKKLIGSNIRRPLLKGYMLDKLILDNNLKLIKVLAKVGTYEQNVYTSHILEYELAKLYSNNKIDITKLKNNEILRLLPFRESIHESNNQLNVISTGINRYSLLGVQLFVMYLDYDTNNYKVLIMKRSNMVAAKPGFLQFIPSGGFEIFNEDDSAYVLKSNFSLRLSLFRELLEEVFGNEEYVHNEGGQHSEENFILENPKIQYLTNLINQNKIFFEFLGSVNDVVVLRHLLSFVIRIDDVEFSKQIFKHDKHEAERILIRNVSELSEFISNEKICNDSAGLFHLVEQNHLYQEIIKTFSNDKDNIETLNRKYNNEVNNKHVGTSNLEWLHQKQSTHNLSFIEKVRKLIGNAKTKEAINELVSWANNNNNQAFKNKMLLLSAQLVKLQEDKNIGLLSDSEETVKLAKINYGILNLLNIDEMSGDT